MIKSVFKRFTAAVALTLSCVIAMALPGLASAQTLNYGTLGVNVPDEAEIEQVDTSDITADEASIQEVVDMLQQAGLEVDEEAVSQVMTLLSEAQITTAVSPSEQDVFFFLPAAAVSEQLGMDVSELQDVDSADWNALVDEVAGETSELTDLLPNAGIEISGDVVNGNPVLCVELSNISLNEVGYVVQLSIAFIPGDTDPGMLVAIGVSTADGSDLDANDLLLMNEAEGQMPFGGAYIPVPANSMTFHVNFWGFEFGFILGEDGLVVAYNIESPVMASSFDFSASDIIAMADELNADAPEGITYQGEANGNVATVQVEVTGEVIQELLQALADEFSAGNITIDVPGITADEVAMLLGSLSESEMPDVSILSMIASDSERIQALLGFGIAGSQTLAYILG